MAWMRQGYSERQRKRLRYNEDGGVTALQTRIENNNKRMAKTWTDPVYSPDARRGLDSAELQHLDELENLYVELMDL